jgi:hypothetical protein
MFVNTVYAEQNSVYLEVCQLSGHLTYTYNVNLPGSHLFIIDFTSLLENIPTKRIYYCIQKANGTYLRTRESKKKK